MTPSPYSPEGVGLARRVLTDTSYWANVTRDARAELTGMAFDILHKDRAARLGLTGTPPESPRVIVIPHAVFQAGRRKPCRPRLVVLPKTPGDAA